MTIVLTKKHKKRFIEEAKKKYPIEACGLVFGNKTKKKVILKKIIPLCNIANSPTSFKMDPVEFLKIKSDIEKGGTRFLCFYHSHPSDTKPSKMDLKYMRLWPETIWIIISSLNYEIAAFKNANNSVEALKFELT
jgi:proteasome lid subunit RPN8/RPN11